MGIIKATVILLRFYLAYVLNRMVARAIYAFLYPIAVVAYFTLTDEGIARLSAWLDRKFGASRFPWTLRLRDPMWEKRCYWRAGLRRPTKSSGK
jgi:hypothetical protein